MDPSHDAWLPDIEEGPETEDTDPNGQPCAYCDEPLLPIPDGRFLRHDGLDFHSGCFASYLEALEADPDAAYDVAVDRELGL